MGKTKGKKEIGVFRRGGKQRGLSIFAPEERKQIHASRNKNFQIELGQTTFAIYSLVVARYTFAKVERVIC